MIQNLTFDYSSDYSSDLQETITQLIRVNYADNKFDNLDQKQQKQNESSVLSQLKGFVRNSVVMHRSNLSVVFLGRKDDIRKEQVQKYIEENCLQSCHQDQLQTLCQEEYLILKVLLFQDKSTQSMAFKNIKNPLEREVHFSPTNILQPFLGFSLFTIKNYFLQSNLIQLQIVVLILKQLIRETKHLHDNKIVHGDICPNNILLRYLKGEQNKLGQIDIQDFLRQQLTSVISALFSQISPKSMDQKSPIRMKLIDLGNSFVQDQSISDNIYSIGVHLPTQTIYYRSPQALYTRGTYPLDIWGIGHILFNLLTGTDLISTEEEITQQQLEEIFKSQEQLHKYILTQIIRFSRPSLNKQGENYNKLMETLKECLRVDPKKRINIKQLYQMWVQ